MTEQSVIAVEAQSLELQTQLAAVVISDQSTYNLAVTARVEGKEWLKGAETFFDGLVKPAYAAYKNLLDTKKKVLEPIEKKIDAINRGLVVWDREQEALRQAEQRRIDAEARQKAEEERLAQVIAMEEAGADKESVSEMLAAPVQVAAVAVAERTYEKSSAVVYRDQWSGVCDDLFKLVQAVAKDKSKIGLLQVNQTSLNQLAKALKESMSIPGVRAVNNKVVASGRG